MKSICRMAWHRFTMGVWPTMWFDGVDPEVVSAIVGKVECPSHPRSASRLTADPAVHHVLFIVETLPGKLFFPLSSVRALSLVVVICLIICFLLCKFPFPLVGITNIWEIMPHLFLILRLSTVAYDTVSLAKVKRKFLQSKRALFWVDSVSDATINDSM